MVYSAFSSLTSPEEEGEEREAGDIEEEIICLAFPIADKSEPPGS
jgi:hypothetical protein